MISFLLLALSLSVSTAYAAEPICEFEEYFAPSDEAMTKPLAKPHPEFAKMRQLARRGDASQQYNLAVAYDCCGRANIDHLCRLNFDQGLLLT